MNDKVASVIQKAQQERKRAQFARALKRLEQGIAAHPDELDLYLEAIDTSIEGGELLQATNFLKTVQDKFARERERVQQFVREKLQTVHDPSLARCAVEYAVKRRDLEAALDLLADVPDHTIRELLNRARTKAQSLKSAAHGGHALRGETVVNELTNAILSVRLSNMKEAMATFVQVVEEKPVEHKAIEAFLAAVASKHPKSGRVRFARACATRAGGNEIEAIQQLVEAARIEPACAASCLEQLGAMLEGARYPGKVRRALAETQLLKGDLDDAALTFREYLKENPENSREVIMLLRPFIDPANGLNACAWLALELSLALEQSSVALELLRPIQLRGHGAELFAWLEEHTAASPSGELTLFHGAVAIEAKQFERAAELLGELCATSSQDVPAVLALIERHRSAHKSIDALCLKYASAADAVETPASGDDGDFQMFESNEFKLEGARAPAPVSPGAPAEKPRPRFNSSPFSSLETDGTAPRPEKNDKPMIERTELSLDDDAPNPVADEGITMPDSPSLEITESHVENVGQELYKVGAAAFFHIDDGTPDADDDSANTHSPEPAASSAARAPSAGAPTAPVEPVHSERPSGAKPGAAKETFAQRFARFSRGELSNADVLELLEEAVSDGHVDELHELLYFEPETSAEHFARYYYQAEYHILCNRPLQALEILARLDMPGLEPEQKRRVWYKIAVSQRMTQNFAGAGETLDRLVQQFPDREDLARLKRRNQEQFIAEQSLAATMLEKTSSLD
jgi:tetratricopeptide (TPR) repeat protein